MTRDHEALTLAAAQGWDALRVHLRALAAHSDRTGLEYAAAWLSAEVPHSLGQPWSAYCLSMAKCDEDAVARYEAWLCDAEAPDCWHIGQLCRVYARLRDTAGVYRAAARLHPWDLAFEPRRVVSDTLRKARVERAPEGVRTYKVSLLTTFTASTLEPCLIAGAPRLGLDLALHSFDLHETRAQLLDSRSAFYETAPEMIVLATTWRDVQPHVAAQKQADEWLEIWDLLLERTNAHIVQHTFDRAAHSPLGHLDAQDENGRRWRGIEINQLLGRRTSERVSLLDYEQAVHRYGAAAWCDARQWNWVREAVCQQAAPHLAEEYLALLRGVTGQSKKVCVFDLDNTLWGGVIAEDGVGGLELGPTSGLGQAHLALQRYAKELKDMGVLLAVCSNNNPEDARAPFREHRDMVLGLDDFVAFSTGWEPKAQRLAAMAAELNLGLDSFVFVDDNPAERAQVRQHLPGVLVVPLPREPSDYVASLHRARAFEALGVTKEDAQRSEHYVLERERDELKKQAPSLDSYLRALEMRGALRPFTSADTARIAQLAARSNQFNLTTWRLTLAEITQLAESPEHVTRTLRLRDRFGDYGLVMVLVGRVVADTLDILAWFMSCRVLGRGVDRLALTALEDAARARGLLFLRGTYIPTAKNRLLVAELYASLGFERVSGCDGETTVWLREVSGGASGESYITLEPSEATT